MKEPIISKGMQHIEEELITEAIEYKRVHSKMSLKRYGYIAAMLSVIVFGALGIHFLGKGIVSNENYIKNEQERTTYLKIDIPKSDNEDGYFLYNIISEVNEYNRNIYGSMSSLSSLKRDFFVKVKNFSKVFFLRSEESTDSDKVRYKEMLGYLGDKREDYLFKLTDIVHEYCTTDTVEGLLIQNGEDEEIVAIGMGVMLDKINNCELYFVASKDFSKIEETLLKEEIEQFKDLSMESSLVDEQEIVIKFFCESVRDDNFDKKENFTYYAYWENDMSYILQFRTGYSSGEASEETQERLREDFEKILNELATLTNHMGH